LLTKHPEVEAVQLQINYVDWESKTIQSGKCYDVCVSHGKPVMVMEPVKGGGLANVPADVEKLYRSCHP
jgi:predicted aldo/keto reductase-like oxidoreductase